MDNKTKDVLKRLKNRKTLQPQVGMYFCITKRRCSDKVQPSVKEMDIFKITSIEETKTGVMVLVCEERVTKKIHRINMERFDGSVFTEKDVNDVEECIRKERARLYMQELNRRKEAFQAEQDREMAQKMHDTFTEKEQLQISFVHLVIAELVWQYAEACINTATNYRISCTKALCHKVKDVREFYNREDIGKRVDNKWKDNIKKTARRFSNLDAFRKTSKFAWEVITKEYGKQFPDEEIQYLDLRIIAQLGMFMVEVYKRQIAKVNKMIDEKIGKVTSYDSVPNDLITDTLVSFFDAMQGDFVLAKNSDLDTIVNTWSSFCDNADFRVTKN